jgi:hypothetical protein
MTKCKMLWEKSSPKREIQDLSGPGWTQFLKSSI